MSMSSSFSTDFENSILTKISNLLIKNNRQQHIYFCVEKELPVSAIDITVKNVGKLQFPLVKEDIEKLIGNSTKTKFGKGSRTLLDKRVRDTNEIKANKLNVTINNDLLKHMLNEMRQELGLPETTVFKPRLYNMLIYGPGQFFKKHRDGEKAKGMIASLVIVLPVEHVGGDLIVKHNTEKHVFFSEDINASNIKYTAFYADCNHKVQKVLQDHSYTEHSLRWNMLKGTDIKNGSAMYNAAQKLNLVPHLALIEISRTSKRNEENERILYKYGPRCAREKMEITFWIDSNNEKLLYDKYLISSEFICCTVEIQNFEPYFKEVKYGNQGYDVDFRYCRAAVILWPISNDMRMKSILNKEKKELKQNTKETK